MMKAKDLYTNQNADPSILEFKVAKQLQPESVDSLAGLGLPTGNTVAFEGEQGLFLGAVCRHSMDKKFLEIASLFGSLRIDAGSLDTGSPIGLIVKTAHGFFQCEALFGADWSKVYPKSRWSLKAKKLGEGDFEPMFNTVASRGQDEAAYRHYIWLPEKPSGIAAQGGGVRIQAGGYKFHIDDERVSQAVLNGKALWVLPGEDGNFMFPEC